MSARFDARRLLIVTTGAETTQPVSKYDRVIHLLGSSAPHSAPSWTGEVFKYVENVAIYLEEASRGLPPPQRASILNQAPYLNGWITELLCSANQIEISLAGIRPLEVHIEGRSRSFAELARGFLGPGVTVKSLSGAQMALGTSQTGNQFRRLLLESAFSGRTRSSRTREMTALLLIALQPNATRALLPLARTLLGHSVPIEFLISESDKASLVLLREACHDYRQLSLWPTAKCIAATPSFFSTCARIFHPIELARLLRQAGLPAWANGRALAKGQARALLRQLAKAHVTSFALQRALEQATPQAVLYVTHRAMMNELLSSQERHAVPKKIFFLQGIVPDIPPTTEKLDVDLALAGSLLDRDYLNRCEIPQERQALVGYGDYADFPSLDADECQKAIRTRHPSSGTRPLVVFTSQYRTSLFPDWARLANLHVFLEVARRMPELYFIVLPHPIRESKLQIEQLVTVENASLGQGISTPQMLKGASVVVSYWSTTVLEAVLLGTPMVQLNATGLPDFFQVSEKMGLPVARTIATLEARIRELLGPARAEFLEKRAAFVENFGLDRNTTSAERAGAQVLQMLGGK